MSARIDTITRYQAYCLACGWWGDETESESCADQDADEHDEEKHS